MKQKMKFTALLTAVMTVAALGAPCATAYYLTPTEQMGAWKQVDDGGMFQFYNAVLQPEYAMYVSGDGASLQYVTSAENQFQIILREDDDTEAMQAKALELLKTYYPVCSGAWLYPNYPDAPDAWVDCNGSVMDVYDRTEEGLTAEKKAAIMQAFAENQLISAFYGDMVYTQAVYSEYDYPVQYEDAPELDLDGLQAYLDEQALPCTIQCRDSGTLYGESLKDSVATYFVVPDEAQSYAENFQLAVQIYKDLGLIPLFYIDESTNLTPTANALESAGDVNVNTTLEIGDAILLSRIVAEDATASVCDTGMINADVNADGMTSGEDVTALLRKLANLG